MWCVCGAYVVRMCCVCAAYLLRMCCVCAAYVLQCAAYELRMWCVLRAACSSPLLRVASMADVKYTRWEVHKDWVVELKYEDQLKKVISCSNDPSTGTLVFVCTERILLYLNL